MSVSEAQGPQLTSPTISDDGSMFQAGNSVTFSNSFASSLGFDSQSTLPKNTYRNAFIGPSGCKDHDEDPLSSASASSQDGPHTGHMTDTSSPASSPAVKTRPLPPAKLELRRPSVRFATEPSMPSITDPRGLSSPLRSVHLLNRTDDDSDDGYAASDDYKTSPEDDKMELPQGLTVPGEVAPSLFESRHSVPYMFHWIPPSPGDSRIRCSFETKSPTLISSSEGC